MQLAGRWAEVEGEKGEDGAGGEGKGDGCWTESKGFDVGEADGESRGSWKMAGGVSSHSIPHFLPLNTVLTSLLRP